MINTTAAQTAAAYPLVETAGQFIIAHDHAKAKRRAAYINADTRKRGGHVVAKVADQGDGTSLIIIDNAEEQISYIAN